jgi:thiamine transport system substrate-binding protein
MKKNLLLAMILTLLITACSIQRSNSQTTTLTIMTHDSFEVSAELVKSFENENNVKLSFLKSGDAGSALNKAILSKSSPLADVFYGVDNTFFSRAIESGIFDAYDSPALKSIPEKYHLDQGNHLLSVDYGDVCINYDKAYFSEHKLPIPQTLEELIKPEYKNMLVMENPATSSTGLAFLLASISHFGQENYMNFWKSLRTNGLVVVDDWSTAYYTNFSGSSGHGAQPLVVSYASSPAAEVVYAETALTEAPTGSITSAGTCFRQIEFVGILKGTLHRQLAEKFVDFMLGVQFQEDMPLQMFVYPVNPDAKLPSEFVLYAQLPASPASIDPDVISNNREKWIAAWTDTVLH